MGLNKYNLYNRMANWLIGSGVTRRDLRELRPTRYRPAFSMGYRGFAKTEKPCGTVPAPTIDQVRARERKYGQRIGVRNGIMFFLSDWTMWTKEEAIKRSEA